MFTAAPSHGRHEFTSVDETVQPAPVLPVDPLELLALDPLELPAVDPLEPLALDPLEPLALDPLDVELVELLPVVPEPLDPPTVPVADVAPLAAASTFAEQAHSERESARTRVRVMARFGGATIVEEVDKKLRAAMARPCRKKWRPIRARQKVVFNLSALLREPGRVERASSRATRSSFMRYVIVLLAALTGCTAQVSGGSSSGSSGAQGASSGSTGGGSGSSGSTGSGTTTGSGGSTGSTGGSSGSSGGAQTVSKWLGTNVSADLYFVDVAHQLAPFDTTASQKDANGYPLAGVDGSSSTDIGFVLPSGTYTLVWTGTGSVAVSGIGQRGAVSTSNGVNTAPVTITGTPGAFGNFLNLTIQNGAGQSVTNVQLLYPGFAAGTSQIFLPQFLALLTPFRALRVKDWLATDNSTITNFSDHPESTQFGQSSSGQPLDLIVELVNETGKDAWVSIPEHADDAYVTAFADYLRDHLDFARIAAARAAQGNSAPFELIVEESNETWNQGFSAYATYLAIANADTARYDGNYDNAYGPSWMGGNTDLMKVGQVEGDRLADHAAIFRTEFDSIGKSDVIAPVLSGWALGAAYTDVALQFIAAHHGDPKTIVSYVAIAPYFAPDDSQTGNLPSLFAGCSTAISAFDPVFADFQNLTAQYGLKMAAYEGGQSLSGTTNQPLKHLAQHDARMYQAYLTYFASWKQHFGDALFMHFNLAGDPGLPENIYQYGYWGSIPGVNTDLSSCGDNLPTLTGSESIASVVQYCPKYRALREQVP